MSGRWWRERLEPNVAQPSARVRPERPALGPPPPTDLLPTATLANLERENEVLVRFIRRAQSAFGSTYYLVPQITEWAPHCQPQEAVQLIVVTPGTVSWGPSATAADINAQTSGFVPTLQLGGGVPPTTFPVIVPDSIAAVTVHYPTGKAGGFDRKRLPAATVTAHAIGNVIVLRVPRAGQQANGAGTATVRGRDRQILAATDGV